MKEERIYVDIEQQKLMKLFKMIWMLKPPHGKTVQQLVTDMDMSQASVYRYLDFLDETHFFKVVLARPRNPGRPNLISAIIIYYLFFTIYYLLIFRYNFR